MHVRSDLHPASAGIEGMPRYARHTLPSYGHTLPKSRVCPIMGIPWAYPELSELISELVLTQIMQEVNLTEFKA